MEKAIVIDLLDEEIRHSSSRDEPGVQSRGLAPLDTLSLAGQEHGRTIPLWCIKCRTSVRGYPFLLWVTLHRRGLEGTGPVFNAFGIFHRSP